uniref:RING-type domain-containing protein n=1 Tax=viral metagenome TaxID=1070528 RepID=A0A6C0D9N2_9ZZZZ
MFQSRNRRNHQEFYLTHDQRLLLDVYLNFYNQTTRQIDLLYELQDEIRSNINVLVGLNSNNNTFNRNFQTNQRHGRRSNNQPNNIYQQRHASQNNTDYTSRQRQNYIEGTPYLVTMTNLLRNSYMNNRNQNHNQNQNETITPIWRSFYDAVQVVPTQAQIDNATRNVNYSEIETPTNNSCPITLERFESNSPVTQILYCGHIFSNTGLNSWLRTNVRCPVCRYDIREYRRRERDLRNVYSRNHNNNTNESMSQQDNNQQNSAETIAEDVESNDETREGYEETKEESIPNNHSSSYNEERNSNSRRQENIRHMNLNDELTNILTNVTEELLSGFLRPNSYQTNNLTSSLFDPSYNSFFFDSSNNQIVFEGYMRR